MKKYLIILLLLVSVKAFSQQDTIMTDFKFIGNISIYLEGVDYSDSTVMFFVKVANPSDFKTNIINVNLASGMKRYVIQPASNKQDIVDFNNKNGIKDPNNYLSQYY